MPSEDKSEGTGMKTIGLLAIGLIAGIIIGVLIGAFAIPQTQSQTSGISRATELKPEEIGAKTVDFINNNLVKPGTEVELNDINEESGLYNVTTSYRDNQISVYITKDGELLFLQGLGWVQIETFKDLKKQRENQTRENQTQELERKHGSTIGNFTVSEDEICKEEDKPIIYYFGSSGCPSCKWEHPVIVNVTSNFEEYISFHDNMDSDSDREIFSKYSTGYIPTIVLGCKYYRVGAGTGMGEEQESKVLTALICDLTGNKPADVCSDLEIEALVAQLG